MSIEADNTRRMRHYFTGSTMMYVPEVYMDTKDVMVAERITGVPISDTATFDRLGMDRAQLAEKGLTISLRKYSAITFPCRHAPRQCLCRNHQPKQSTLYCTGLCNYG